MSVTSTVALILEVTGPVVGGAGGMLYSQGFEKCHVLFYLFFGFTTNTLLRFITFPMHSRV